MLTVWNMKVLSTLRPPWLRLCCNAPTPAKTASCVVTRRHQQEHQAVSQNTDTARTPVCVTKHWHQQKHQSVSQRADTSMNTNLCRNAPTPARTPICRNAPTPTRTPICVATRRHQQEHQSVSQRADTSKNTNLCRNAPTPARTPSWVATCQHQQEHQAGSQRANTSKNTKLGHNAPTPERTPRLHQNIVVCCRVMWGLSSATISSLHNCIHPPEMEINPLKTAYGCTCVGVRKKQPHTQSSNPMECICQCTSACDRRPPVWSVGPATTVPLERQRQRTVSSASCGASWWTPPPCGTAGVPPAYPSAPQSACAEDSNPCIKTTTKISASFISSAGNLSLWCQSKDLSHIQSNQCMVQG